MSRPLNILRLLLLCLCLPVAAAGQQIPFKHITTDDGLSQISVNCLYVDKEGIIWIGTRDGLNKYNGSTIQTFRPDKKNPNSLATNKILSIVGDGNNTLYILYTEGLAVLDLTVEKINTLVKGNINCIYYNDGLYACINNEIFKYDADNNRLALYRKIKNKGVSISCMHAKGKYLWLGTSGNGVYRLDTESNNLIQPINTGSIISIYEDNAGDLWMGSWENGLYHIFSNGKTEQFLHREGDDRSISSNFVRACCEDNLGNLWIGTFNGLDRYDKSTGHFHTHSTYNDKQGDLTHNSIWCIVKDHQGTLWLGTYFGGVNYFNPEFEIFNRYSVSNVESEGLSCPIVGKMVESPDGNLWIGTEGGGVDFYDRTTQKFKWYDSGKNNISHNNVKSLYYDSGNNVLWIGTHTGGLNRLDVKSGAISHYRMKVGDPASLPSDIIRDIIPYGDKLIIGTQFGACVFNPKNGKCSQLFRDSAEGLKITVVTSVMLDKDGLLWVAATGEGVFRYNFNNNELVNFRHVVDDSGSLSNNDVNNIMQDRKGNIWFATSGSGLDVLRCGSKSFEHYNLENNGLLSDCIYNVLESPITGKLLLATNIGLSIFDTKTGQFKNYGVENGFPMTAVNENSLCATRDGVIFLGGMKGMISFRESALDFPSKPYNILLSRLYVNGKEIRPGDKSGILTHLLNYTDRITLHHSASLFSIEIAASNYITENKDDIVYMLKGFSNEWNSVRNNTITYSNLNPGTYELVIEAKNNNETICRPARLKIKILPPFYKTVPAILFYCLVAGLIIYFLLKGNNTRIKLRESLKYEKQYITDIEALNQSKLRFFTNISHEFRTPLTLIIAQAEDMINSQTFTPQMYNKLLGIYKNSIQLRDLITELLDFSKQEQGHMKIKVSPHDIVAFFYENYLLFKNYSTIKNINFIFEKGVDKLEVWYDQAQLQKVINNLLSNAIKHSKDGDTITLGITKEGEFAVLRVSDTGCGIDADEVDKIFNRFYQVDDKGNTAGSSGIGIGLALTKGIVELHHGTIVVKSKPGQGSTFIVKLPLGTDYYGGGDIATDADSLIRSDYLQRKIASAVKIEQREETTSGKVPDIKILIVEDNDAIREVLVEIFRPYYNVLSASNGKQGLELVQSEMPDIVVSDIVMPEMSGTELCKVIKNDMNYCHIPVVLLTARGCLEQNIEEFRIGADDYIIKPFDTNLLISRCNNLINSRRILQEKFSRQPQAQVQMLATNQIDKEIMDRAISIIESHIDDVDFDVTVFSREMAMARTNLFAKLKVITGQTPNDFIQTIRLKKGALMLRNNPEMNIAEIADKIGFSSSRYFSKRFKKIYHVSPLAYRQGKDIVDD